MFIPPPGRLGVRQIPWKSHIKGKGSWICNEGGKLPIWKQDSWKWKKFGSEDRKPYTTPSECATVEKEVHPLPADFPWSHGLYIILMVT